MNPQVLPIGAKLMLNQLLWSAARSQQLAARSQPSKAVIFVSSTFHLEDSWLQSKLPSDPTDLIAWKLLKAQSNWLTLTAPSTTSPGNLLFPFAAVADR
jgi:hypothetical protein